MQHDDRPWAEIEAAAEAVANEVLARMKAEIASKKSAALAEADATAGEHRDDE